MTWSKHSCAPVVSCQWCSLSRLKKSMFYGAIIYSVYTPQKAAFPSDLACYMEGFRSWDYMKPRDASLKHVLLLVLIFSKVMRISSYWFLHNLHSISGSAVTCSCLTDCLQTLPVHPLAPSPASGVGGWNEHETLSRKFWGLTLSSTSCGDWGYFF